MGAANSLGRRRSFARWREEIGKHDRIKKRAQPAKRLGVLLN
jgi:hypothetical protein